MLLVPLNLACFDTGVYNHDVLTVSDVFFVRHWDTLAFWSLPFVIIILFAIVAIVALAQLGTGDSGLETLAVVLLALSFAAVTSFEVVNPVV